MSRTERTLIVIGRALALMVCENNRSKGLQLLEELNNIEEEARKEYGYGRSNLTFGGKELKLDEALMWIDRYYAEQFGGKE